jgi:hypothetical protein
METHVHGSGYDGKYKYGEMQCQNSNNEDARNYNQRTHRERNEIQFMIIIWTQKRKTETSKSTQKMIIRRPLK